MMFSLQRNHVILFNMAKIPSFQNKETMKYDIWAERIWFWANWKKSSSFSTGEVLKNLNKFYKRKEIQRLGAENGLDGKKMF